MDPNAPLQFSRSDSCSLSFNKQKLYLDFIIPVINTTLHLVEADPFFLYTRSANQTCNISYSGPTHAIIHTTQDCIYSANIHKSDIILAPNDVCDSHRSNLQNTTKYFRIDGCVPLDQDDPWNFVQIKQYYH